MQDNDDILEKLINDTSIDKETEKLIEDHLCYYKRKLSELFKYDNYLDAKDTELGKKRINVYCSYKDIISKFIDKYEIRYHDLPEVILEMLNGLVIEYSSSFRDDIVSNKERVKYVDRAIKIEGCLGYSLCCFLIKAYLKDLKKYKRMFSLLDNASVKYGDAQESFYQHLKGEISVIKKFFKNGKKQYKSFFTRNKKGIAYNFEKISSISSFDNALKLCEKLLKDIEGENDVESENRDGYFSKIFSNGGKISLKTKAFKFLINVGIPSALTIIAAILWAIQ